MLAVRSVAARLACGHIPVNLMQAEGLPPSTVKPSLRDLTASGLDCLTPLLGVSQGFRLDA